MANMEENRKKLKKKEHAAQEENTNPETPVFDQQKFLEILGGLVERAKKKKNMLEPRSTLFPYTTLFRSSGNPQCGCPADLRR